MGGLLVILAVIHTETLPWPIGSRSCPVDLYSQVVD